MPTEGPYEVELKPSAAKALAKMPNTAREAIAGKIEELKADPRPRGSKKLSGQEGLYRVRSGDYRILYQVRDDRLTVLVVRIADRKDAYEGP